MIDRVGFLERIGAFNAMILGCSDYEAPVRKSFSNVMEALLSDLDLDQSLTKFKKLDLCTTHGSRRRVNSVEKMSNDEFDEDDVSDVINGIVEAGDGELAASLLTPASDDVPSLIQIERKSVKDLTEFVHQFKIQETPQEDVLDSILEDIISSVSDPGLVETIDCY